MLQGFHPLEDRSRIKTIGILWCSRVRRKGSDESKEKRRKFPGRNTFLLCIDVLHLGLSTGWAKLVLDPTRTRPVGVKSNAKGPEIDRRRQSVESVLSSGDARVGSVSGESRQILETSPESSKTLPKSTKTHFICTKNHQDHEITTDLDEELEISTGSGRKSQDLH